MVREITSMDNGKARLKFTKDGVEVFATSIIYSMGLALY